jgi:hypothetical protein
MNINKLIKEEFENTTMRFFHGGDLDDIKHNHSHKSGRYEFGAGLYMVNDYNVVQKYIKGGRKLYIVDVLYGNNIDGSYLDYEIALDFINTRVLTKQRKSIINFLQKHLNNNKVPADIFNNIILNHNAIPSSKTNELKNFLLENNIDYEISFNSFGFGEYMMILYNTRLIKNIEKTQTSKLEIFKFKDTYK